MNRTNAIGENPPAPRNGPPPPAVPPKPRVDFAAGRPVERPVMDNPVYWLAQIEVIAGMESRNVFTKAEMCREVQEVIDQFRKHSAHQRRLQELALRKEPNEQ